MSTATQVAWGDSPQRFHDATISIRLEGAREAIKRARLAFLASTIASLAIFITVWNTYVSWDRRFPLLDAFPKNEITKEITTQLIRQYADSTVISVSLLGIHVGVSDLSVLGSVSLLVLSIWLFFNIRRQNHTVAYLLRDTKNDALEIRQFVYYSISSFLVFTTLSRSDSPISDLGESETGKMYHLTRWAVTFLFYLPAVVVAFVMAMDFISIYVLSSVASFPHDPLTRGIGQNYQVKFWIMDCFAIALGAATVRLCYKINQFEKATTVVLRKYLDDLSKQK